MQDDSVHLERKDGMLQTNRLSACLSGIGIWPCTMSILVCMGCDQETEIGKTVLQILYTDFFPTMQPFFLKNVQHVKPKCTRYFVFNIN